MRRVVLSACGAALMGAGPGHVEIQVTGVRDARGHVRVSLCTETTFLRQCEHVGTAPARPGTVVVRLTGVKPGVYAAQAFHDDDNSGRLERPLIGFPRKGFGFSHDAPFRFGPPRFADAAVTIGPAGGTVPVPLRYR